MSTEVILFISKSKNLNLKIVKINSNGKLKRLKKKLIKIQLLMSYSFTCEKG